MDVEIIEKNTITQGVINKEPLLLPAPKTEYEKRQEWICKLAEEIHPGCWDFGMTEPNLLNWFNSNVSDNIDPECTCKRCKDGNTCEFRGAASPRLLIKFPKVKISNSQRQHYEIEDMYIAIIFNNTLSRTRFKGMTALKTTTTTKELYNSGFIHPHASRLSVSSELEHMFQWRNLCLGGDTELTDILYTLTTDSVNYKDLHELLVLLHIYVGWESLEGGPYHRFKDVVYPQSSSRRLNLPSVLSTPPVLFNTLSKYYLANPEAVRPEITGNISDLAITNVNDSLVPAIKRLAIQMVYDGVISERELYRTIGIHSPIGFTPLVNGSADSSIVSQCKMWVEAAEGLNKTDTTKIISWKSEKVEFVVTLDPNGLGLEEASEEAVLPTFDELLSNTYTVDTYLTTNFTYHYLGMVREFKLTKQIER